MLLKYSCLPFHPTTLLCSTHPRLPPSNLPPLALSMCPLYMLLDNPSPFSPHYSLPPCLWLLSVLNFKVMEYLIANYEANFHRNFEPFLAMLIILISTTFSLPINIISGSSHWMVYKKDNLHIYLVGTMDINQIIRCTN